MIFEKRTLNSYSVLVFLENIILNFNIIFWRNSFSFNLI
nr:MAG TPA: hypothetical protein [Caudoviricetes sp.]